MKKRALAIALSLVLLLSVFVPGTLATSSTETETDTTTVVSQSDTEVLAEDGEGTQSGDEQTALTDGETVTGDGQTTDEGKVPGDGQTADPTETTTAPEGSEPTETTAATDPTETIAATDPTETTAATEPTETTAATDPTETTATTDPTETTAATDPTEPANIMPQLMMLIEQDMLAGGSEKIDPNWFEFDGVTKPEDFTGVQEGPITADKVPTISGHSFAGAFVNGIAVKNIGQIKYKETTYVYYTTEDSSDVAALILEGEMKITLQYKLNPVPINYSVTVNGVDSPNLTANGVPYGETTPRDVKVIPDSNPKEVFPGDSYTFTVEIPRGYVATVSVNDVKQAQQLGVSPTYTRNGNTIVRNGELAKYQAQYTVEISGTENNVAVELTKGEYNFSHVKMNETVYFAGRASYVPGLEADIGLNGELTWIINANSGWRLNKMEINETMISVPFADGSVETVLPSGTRVELTRVTRGGAYQYTFKFTNCYENLVVTSGNLNGTSWEEYMPYTYVGVESAEYYKDGNWVEMKIGQPVAKDTLEEMQSSTEINGNEKTETEKYTAKIRVKLLPGYGEPVLTINGTEIRLNPDGEWYVSDSTVVYVVEKYYKWSDGFFGVGRGWKPDGSQESDCDFDGYTRLIEIKAQPINVNVEYAGGEIENPDGMPTDDGTYNLTNSNQVLIPLAIPKDSTNEMVFTGWENGGKEYLPNQLVPLENLDIENGTAVFTAQWVDVENAQQINFTIQIKDGDKVLGEIPSSAPKNVPIILDVNSTTILDWLEKNSEYDLAENNQLYYMSIENNQKVVLNVVEKAVTIQYKVVGPDGCGTVSPEREEVKIKSGEAKGSAPTAKPGYRFVGWYADEACTQQVDTGWVDADNKLTPKKSGDLWEDAVYYAKFEPAVASLTITASGIEGTYDEQGTIYQVQVEAADGTNDVTFYVSINGNSSVTIENLPYGEYTVSPMNDWSWRYGDLNSQTVTPVVQGDGTMAASVTFDYGIQNYKWLSGNDYFVCGN